MSKYDPGKGASFETYAGIRIRGAIIDEVRRGDWTPRSVHRNGRRVSEAIAAVERRTGRDAQDADVAAELGISMEAYHALLQDSLDSRLFSYDELAEAGEHSAGEQFAGDDPGPSQKIQQGGLPPGAGGSDRKTAGKRELVLALYYDEELNLKEIGKVLGVTESRVSQIHSQAAARLRARLRDWQ